VKIIVQCYGVCDSEQEWSIYIGPEMLGEELRRSQKRMEISKPLAGLQQ